MFQWGFLISLLIILILSSGLLYTLRVAKRQRYQGEYDTEISSKIEEHPITRNPVFLVYIVGIAVALAYMVFVAINSNY